MSGQNQYYQDTSYAGFLHWYAKWVEQHRVKCKMSDQSKILIISPVLGMASVVCVLVKICVSSISLYKLDTDKLTAPFESAHQFTLVCTVSDSKTVPGCHYNLCSNHMQFCSD